MSDRSKTEGPKPEKTAPEEPRPSRRDRNCGRVPQPIATASTSKTIAHFALSLFGELGPVLPSRSLILHAWRADRRSNLRAAGEVA